MDNIKSLIEIRSGGRGPSGPPDLDGEADRRPLGDWPLILAIGSVVIIPTYLIVKWFAKRGRATTAGLILLASACSIGCSRPGTTANPPAPRLVARLAETWVLYDPRNPRVATALVLEDRGDHPTRVLGVSGGCTCRKVDASTLPALVPPGGTLPLKEASTEPAADRTLKIPVVHYMPAISSR